MAAALKDDLHVRLNDGRLMPLLGLGTWVVGDSSFLSAPSEVSSAVECALSNGYRLIDSAYNYSNEEELGEGIRRWGGNREDLFITSKLPGIGMRPDLVEKFLRLTLSNLGLDYVDLYLLHTPMGIQYVADDTLFPMGPDGNLLLDFGTDLIAIWKAMEAVRAAGLAKSIGVSNCSTRQLRRLIATSTVPPAVHQLEMHLEFQQRENMDYCREVGIAVTSYATFGSPGRRNTSDGEGVTFPSLLEHPVVGLVATAHAVPPSRVLLRYFVQQGIAVIPKSVTPARIADNAKIFDFQLTDLEMDALRTLDRGEEGRSFIALRKAWLQLHPECPI